MFSNETCARLKNYGSIILIMFLTGFSSISNAQEKKILLDFKTSAAFLREVSVTKNLEAPTASPASNFELELINGDGLNIVLKDCSKFASMSKLVCLANNLITEVKYALTHVSYAVITINGQKLTDKATLTPSNARTALKLSLVKSNSIKLQVGGLPTASVRIIIRENSILPIAPVAVATADIAKGVAPEQIMFSGLGSYDADGSLASFEWTFSDGQSATGPTPSVIFRNAGAYTASLVVTDNSGLKSVPSVLTIELAQDQYPIPVMTVKNTESRRTKILDATGTTDPDTPIWKYEWIVNNVVVSNDITTTYTFPEGSTVLYLRVWDTKGYWYQLWRTIEVRKNLPPVAAIKTMRTESAVVFDASPSTDDGSVVAYTWKIGDSAPIDGKVATKSVQPGDIISAELIVIDDEGLSSSKRLKYVDPILRATISTAFADTELITNGPRTITLDNLEDSVTVDAYISASEQQRNELYEIDYGDGTIVKGSSSSHRYKSPGSYTVRVTVSLESLPFNSLSAQVIVANNSCLKSEDDLNCFEIIGAHSNVIPISSGKIEIRDTSGIKFGKQQVILPWTASLLSSNGVETDITEAITVHNDLISLDIASLRQIASISGDEYSIRITGFDDAGTSQLSGTISGVKFGQFSLTLINDGFAGPIRLTGRSTGSLRELNLVSGRTIVSDLPVDLYTIENISGALSVKGTVFLQSDLAV
ncbi:MAG: PKD domain-containing protein [Proteobacteria bacterium]|nr:MAG: PKD domain-containing protein [Pseudomonadota bacterium]